jgi:hypothetical protein
VYRVVTDELVQQQLDALPADALAAFAELRTLLEVHPWSGEPLNKANASGGVLTMAFGPHGEGLAYYLMLEDQRRVDLLTVIWTG